MRFTYKRNLTGDKLFQNHLIQFPRIKIPKSTEAFVSIVTFKVKSRASPSIKIAYPHFVFKLDEIDALLGNRYIVELSLLLGEELEPSAH